MVSDQTQWLSAVRGSVFQEVISSKLDTSRPQQTLRGDCLH